MAWARRGARSGEREPSLSDPTMRLPLRRRMQTAASSRIAADSRAETMFGVVDESLLMAARPTLATLGLFFICMATWPKPVTTARIPMIVVSFAFMAQYAWWRTTETLPAPALTFEYALALSFFVAEMLGIGTAALSLM